nr:MAG TPA: hypothetical protein [Caudoviricetes sp.]
MELVCYVLFRMFIPLRNNSQGLVILLMEKSLAIRGVFSIFEELRR